VTNSDNIVPREFLDALDTYDQDADRVLRPFVEALDSTPPPPTIYHYTNDLGLKGILETGTFWFTDIFDLNDPSELRHGFSQAVNILENGSRAELPETQKFAADFARFNVEGAIEESGHFFVCCFSAAGDDLGQWRAYADNGCGFALGFEAPALEQAFAKKDGIPILNHSSFPVTYDDQRLIDIQNQLVQKMLHLISLPRSKRIHPAAINPYMWDLATRHAIHITRAVLFFKHEAYKNEAEYRFLQLYSKDRTAPAVKYRHRPYSLVRYREFDWKAVAPKALNKIVIGPAADRAKAVQFARDCMEAFHTEGEISIVHSTIPYRSR